MMVFTINMKVFSWLLYFLIFNKNKYFVYCQYSSDYLDLDNAISTDGNAYYYSKAPQYENVNQGTDIGATVNLKLN